MARTQELEGTPEQLAGQLTQLTKMKLYRIEEVVNGASPLYEMDSSTASSHVNALLHKWQHDDNTPVAQPAPNDGTMTASEALFKKWAAEDALLTPEEVEEETKFWKDYLLNDQRVAL